MGPKKLRMHKGMVLTLLSALTQLTHASLRSPVSMPLIPYPGTRSGHQAQILAQDAWPSHTPKGIQQW